MHSRRLGQARALPRLAEAALQHTGVQRSALAVAEQVIRGPVLLPVAAQFDQQAVRQRQAAILVAFAAADPERVPATVEVRQTQAQDLAQTQATAVSQSQHQAVAVAGDGG